jgi:hypothetical protein
VVGHLSTKVEVIKGLEVKLDVQKNCTKDARLIDAAVTNEEAKGKNPILCDKSTNLKETSGEEWKPEEWKENTSRTKSGTRGMRKSMRHSLPVKTKFV